MGGTLTCLAYLYLFISALNPIAFTGSRLYLMLYRLSCPTAEPIGFLSISNIGTIRMLPFCAFDVIAVYPLRCASCTAYFNLYVIFISLPILSIASARPLCYRLLAVVAFPLSPSPPDYLSDRASAGEFFNFLAMLQTPPFVSVCLSTLGRLASHSKHIKRR